MTAIEAINEITKQTKYYMHCEPQMKQVTASRIVVAIRAGTCKPKTERSFLKAFGYNVAEQTQYEKGGLS